jgi:hypothetical protein
VRQETALGALAAGATITDAAKLAECSRSTLYEWKRDPRFAAELRARQREARAAFDARLVVLERKAIEALDAMLTDPSWRARASAAKAILLARRPAADPDQEAHDAAEERTLRSYDGSIPLPPPDSTPEERENMRIMIAMIAASLEKTAAARRAGSEPAPGQR